MATASRRPDAAVTPRSRIPATDAEANAAMLDAIAESPTAFGFYQVVRLLSRLQPERARVGRWSDPSREVARFHASTSLGFPASEIQELTLARGETSSEPTDMLVNFFGLTGPQGVMPHVYTEHASTRARARDTAFRDFLDLFNHRAISLLFRAWEKNNAVVAHESGSDDRFFDHLLDLAGLGTAGLRDRLPVSDSVPAFYASLLSSRSRPAEGLARLIGDYFDVPASVEQFVGEWRSLDSGGQSALEDDVEAGKLGFGVLGDAVWDPHARVRLRLGPLTRIQFDELVPGGAAHDTLRSLARLYADDMVGVDAQLVLARREVTPCVLDVPDGTSARRGPGLGRGTWLASRPLSRDPDETTLRLC
jgi:type VI secretion system protein ImpH